MKRYINISKRKLIILATICVMVFFVGFFSFKYYRSNDEKNLKKSIILNGSDSKKDKDDSEKKVEKNDDSTDDSEKKVEKNDDSTEEIGIAELSKYIFLKDMSYLSINDLDGDQLIKKLVLLSGKSFEKVTGNELKQIAKKYFNLSSFEFVNVSCDSGYSDHDTTMYIYNPQTDKYEYNKNHPGHGGESDGIFYQLEDESTFVENDFVVYSAKIYFVYNGCISDTCGPTGIHEIYRSYEDASQRANMVLNAFDSNFCVDYYCDDKKIYTDIKEKLKTVKFYYKNVDDNYLFEYYEIK